MKIKVIEPRGDSSLTPPRLSSNGNVCQTFSTPVGLIARNMVTAKIILCASSLMKLYRQLTIQESLKQTTVKDLNVIEVSQ